MTTGPKIASLVFLDSAHVRGVAPNRWLNPESGGESHIVCLDNGALRSAELLQQPAHGGATSPRVIDGTSAPAAAIAQAVLGLDADYVQLGFDPFWCEAQTFELLGMELFLRPADVLSLDYLVERGGVVHHRATSLCKRVRAQSSWDGRGALAIDLAGNLISTALVRAALPTLLALPRAAHWWRLGLLALLPAQATVRHAPLMAGILQNDGPLVAPVETESAPTVFDALVRLIAAMGEDPGSGPPAEWLLALRCCADLPPVLRDYYQHRLRAIHPAEVVGATVGDSLLPVLFDVLQLANLINGEISVEEQQRILDEACRVEVTLRHEASWAGALLPGGLQATPSHAALVERVLRAEREANQWRAMVASLQSDLFNARMQVRNWKRRFTRVSESRAE